MRHLGLRDGLITAIKIDTLSLIAYQVGMFAWMGFRSWLSLTYSRLPGHIGSRHAAPLRYLHAPGPQRGPFRAADQQRVGRFVECRAGQLVAAAADPALHVGLAGLVASRRQAEVRADVTRPSEAVRPVDRGAECEGEWPHLWLDATYVKARRDHHIVSVAVIVAMAVNTDGRREVLGMTIGNSEAEPFWTEFLRSLTRRGLRGVKLVISDAHKGLKAAITKVLCATWQRCRVHDEWAVQRARYMSLETIAPLSHDLSVSLPLIAA